MILYCVRHGESTYNAEGRVQGQSDAPLSDLGRRQGQAVAKALAARPADVLYSSPLRRAMQTAQPIADALGLPVWNDDRLMEIDVGIFQDHLRSDLEKRYPEEIRRWASGDHDFVIPGGESRRQLADRGVSVLRDIARLDHQHAVVVAHGRLLAVTLTALVELPPDRTPLSLTNGSITTISLNGDGAAELLALDEIDHLQGVGLAGRGDL